MKVTKKIVQRTSESVLGDFVVPEETIQYLVELINKIREEVLDSENKDRKIYDLLGESTYFLFKENYDMSDIDLQFIDFLSYDVIESVILSDYTSTDTGDLVITPWDALHALQKVEEYVKLFNLPGESKLPITVKLNNNVFTHTLSMEFAFGIALFAKIIPGSYQLMMYNYTFELMPQLKRILERKTQKYELTIGVEKYYFNTEDFMQGFMTGAMWAGVDPKQYIRELNKIEDDGSLTPISMS